MNSDVQREKDRQRIKATNSQSSKLSGRKR